MASKYDPFEPYDPYASRQAYKAYEPCHHKHPDYEVAPGLFVKGGSGVTPRHLNCDVYLSLESCRVPTFAHPWDARAMWDLVYPIKDMQAPSNPETFRAMIEWLAGQVTSGASVHVGCIGGHGRTGTVFSALRMLMTSDVNAIAHVRANYCDKAVETQEQLRFLNVHWGINPVAPTKVVKKDWLNDDKKPASKRGKSKLADLLPDD